MGDPTNLVIPLKLDAFIFNQSVCEGEPGNGALIAPLTQPNYSYLRLDSGYIQGDILDHVDLHNSCPWDTNPRLVNLGNGIGATRAERLGVYLHWMIPRFYRSGTAATSSATATQVQERLKKGFPSRGTLNPENPETDPAPADNSAPEFRQLPNRWLVIRTIDPNASTTQPQGAPVPAVQAWIVESDHLWNINDKDLNGMDLEVDVSPYITTQTTSGGVVDVPIQNQAQVFVGYKTAASGWTEKHAPGADLTVASASNHLFADYQPHCSNVFSTLDSFSYPGPEVNGEPATSYLTSASASYYVLGWHSNPADDPLGNLSSSANPPVTRADRINSLSMKLEGDSTTWPQSIINWMAESEPAAVMCHGAMYDVTWNVDKPPLNVPATQAAQTLSKSIPLAIGTTPMDALLAYINSHKNSDLERDLWTLAPLLRAQDEGVAAQRAASDELQNSNYTRTSGGVHWHFQNAPGSAVQDPVPSDVTRLEKLNQAQRLFDATARQLQQVQWNMFSYWWKYVCLPEQDRQSANYPLDQLMSQHQQLQQLADRQKKKVAKLSTSPKFKQPPKAGVLPEFTMARDPTLLIGGIQAGWPDDYMADLAVRLDNMTVQPSTPISDMTHYCISVVPTTLQSTAMALVQEFVALNPNSSPPPSVPYPPLYHDHGVHGDASGPLRDHWGDTQPWFPLFIEWEAEYYHIPWDTWKMQKTTLSSSLDSEWILGPNVTLSNDSKYSSDIRTLSGRVLLLPQPNFSLQNAIEDLFNTTPQDVLNTYLPNQADRTLVTTQAYTMQIMSGPLDGFTEGLLTLSKGTHIKPNVRAPGQDNQPLAEAGYPADPSSPFKTENLAMIGASSDVTPYGTLVQFLSDEETKTALEQETKKDSKQATPPPTPPPLPFKPVTHGQFRFTKVNVVDKFGQAICAIDPRYTQKGDQTVYPCVSDYYAPQLLSPGECNTVLKSEPVGGCEFAQLPPAINQQSRLNCVFVTQETRYVPGSATASNYSYWRPVTEWESPVWGWIVLNYADYGIQLFLPDGTFYREVRVAAPTAPPPKAPVGSAKWLPFGPPSKAENTTQLDYLIQKLTGSDEYLSAFLSMLGDSIDASSSSAPEAYGSFLSSLVGRPLALVNAGWSLELASPAKVDQSSLDKGATQPLDTGLIPAAYPMGCTNIYQFPLKLGDQNRACDGLVGYFNLSPKPSPYNELNLDTIYTEYAGGDPSGTILIHIGGLHYQYPQLQATYLAPFQYTTPVTKPATPGTNYTRDWNNNLNVLGLIMDPFVPVTTYSGGVQPIGQLQLPPWVWQQAMERMTAFFHMGPVLTTADVQAYLEPANALADDYSFVPPAPDPTVKGSALGMPSLPAAQWAWLQPFVGSSEPSNEAYAALALTPIDSKPGYQQGPYAALEGYLQLKTPLLKELQQPSQQPGSDYSSESGSSSGSES